MLMFILPLIFFLSILFTRLTHPLSAGLTLLIQTTLISLSSGLIAPSFWFSYILFLIFLGGMLVLFIYVASLASNEPFKVSLSSILTISSFSFFLSIFLIFMDPFFSPWTISLQHTFPSMSNEMAFTASLIYSIYNTPALFLTLFVILYLLLTLVVVVYITSVFFGPLRFSK